MKRTLDLQGEKLEFEMTNRTIFEIDERFDNFGFVINGLMYGQNVYNNALKVLVCSCVTNRLDEKKQKKELTIEELKEKLTADQVMDEIIDLATNMYYEYRGVKTKEENSDEDLNRENKKK